MALGCRKLLLNLQEVPYVDSGGLGVLVSKSSRFAGAVTQAVQLQDRVTRVLQITKLLTVFEGHASEADGVKSFTVMPAV